MAGLYIHIPYCHSKCAYCDFYSTPARADEDTLVSSIIKEYEMRKGETTESVDTIYIGGGTPSILKAQNLERLVGALPSEALAEFTIEVNPEDVSADSVSTWRRLGINRVSMGVQTLVDEQLRLIGRRHDALTAIQAFHTIRDGGIDNISLDLIYGLPGQSIDSWLYSLDTLLALQPEHLSAYILSYEPHTRLTAMLQTGKITAVDDDTIAQMYELLIHTTSAHGYEHYEISNFAKPGHRAKHNSGYWDGTPYLGLGPAAHSFDGRKRRVNSSNIKVYISKISAGNTAYEIEAETRTDRFNDMLITRLRTVEGLEFSKVPVGKRLKLLTSAYPYLKSGDLQINDGYLSIPQKRWLISDAIMRELMQ